MWLLLVMRVLTLGECRYSRPLVPREWIWWEGGGQKSCLSEVTGGLYTWLLASAGKVSCHFRRCACKHEERTGSKVEQ